MLATAYYIEDVIIENGVQMAIKGIVTQIVISISRKAVRTYAVLTNNLIISINY